jgi:hypothetical protein
MAIDPGKGHVRRLRLFLRDFRMIEAHASLAEGQSLASWLANRKSYVNLRGAVWTTTNEKAQHVVLRVPQVLWAASLDGDIPLVSAAPTAPPRNVELQLEGGLFMRGGLNLGERQRLSDYLETQPPFIPLRNGQLLRSGRPPKDVNVILGDVVLNQEAVQAMWEVDAQERSTEMESAEARTSAV